MHELDLIFFLTLIFPSSSRVRAARTAKMFSLLHFQRGSSGGKEKNKKCMMKNACNSSIT